MAVTSTPETPARRVARELAGAVGDFLQILATAGKGVTLTTRTFFEPKITVQYPYQKLPVPETFRGRLVNDIPKCIACDLCARECPPDCIVVEWELAADKKRILTKYTIDMTKCCYCGLCTEVCPTECLTMDGGYEYSSKNKEDHNFWWVADEAFLAEQRSAAEKRAKAIEEKAKAAKAAAAAAAAKKAAGSAPVLAPGRKASQ